MPELTTQIYDATDAVGRPWWATAATPPLPDNRTAPWDESAEEGPDEYPPAEGPWPARGGYDRYRDDPATGPYHVPGWVPRGADDQRLGQYGRELWARMRPTSRAQAAYRAPSAALGDWVQTIEGLQGPPYAYYGGSAFTPEQLPPVGAMWLPGHRLATKMPGDQGTVFHANPPVRWTETDQDVKEYPAWDGPAFSVDERVGPRIYAQPIQAREPTGWDVRTGLYPRGHYFPGRPGPSVSGLGQGEERRGGLTPLAGGFLLGLFVAAGFALFTGWRPGR